MNITDLLIETSVVENVIETKERHNISTSSSILTHNAVRQNGNIE